jgi:AcrR family transcriptional regulator
MDPKRTAPASAKRPRGRPSVAPEQRTRIIEAFVKAMRRHGFTGATVDRVAKSLGISRTLIFHYFGDMKVLTRAVAEYITKNSIRDLGAALEGLSPVERRKVLADFTVEGPHFEQLRDVAVLADIDSLAGQDAGVAAMLAEMWELQIGAVVEALVNGDPHASRNCTGG